MPRRSARAMLVAALFTAACGRLAYRVTPVPEADGAHGDGGFDAPDGDGGDLRDAVEAALDAPDAAPDAPPALDVLDAPDAPLDALPDAPLDALPDAPLDALPDAPDVLADAPDAAPDAPADSPVDSPTDAAPTADAPLCPGSPGISMIPPPDGFYRAGDILRVVLVPEPGITLDARRAGEVTVTAQLDSGPVALAPVSTTGSRFTFERVLTPADFDSGSVRVTYTFPEGALVDDGGCRAPETSGSDVRARTIAVHAGLACPDGYAYVPPNGTYSTPRGFCVSATEMTVNSGSPSPEFAVGQVATSGISRADAIAACALLGPDYRLMTNSDWQVVARNVERTHGNWSGLEPARGRLNIGHTGPNFVGVHPSLDPCIVSPTVRFSSCNDRGTIDWDRKRTHELSNGARVWDLGGNVAEWMSDAPTSTPRSYACALAGPDRFLFGPTLTYSPCPSASDTGGEPFGLGYAEGSGADVIIRGSSAGIDGTDHFVTRGIFYSNTNAFWSGGRAVPTGPGFRCAYAPPGSTPAQPVIDPVHTTVRPGSMVSLRVLGDAPATLTWALAAPASGGVVTPDLIGGGATLTAGPSPGTRHVVTATAPDGRVFTAWIEVGAPAG